MFEDLPKNHFGVIYADPPWHYATYSTDLEYLKSRRNVGRHYQTMESGLIKEMPVSSLLKNDCVLFMWVTWPTILDAFDIIKAWGFEYKTCGFSWIKANARQMEFFNEDTTGDMTLGYWTRANSEVCLLATRGSPKRLDAGVRQAIIEPRRQHSRKPDCVYGRIERLVAGPYLELFARTTHPGWSSWGNQVDKFAESVA